MHGRDLFMNGNPGKLACGFCHTLRAASTSGPFGPDLDNLVADHRLRGFTSARIQRLVRHQIAHPLCLDPNDPSRCMPTNLVTGYDADSVAVFVAKCAGINGRTGIPREPGCRPSEAFPKLTGTPAEGQQLYARLGCVGCHFSNGNTAVAPSFKGLAGSKVKLANGETVVADDAYLLESIVAPDAKIVNGFPRGLMSARIPPGSVTIAQAKAIIAYIKTLK